MQVRVLEVSFEDNTRWSTLIGTPIAMIAVEIDGRKYEAHSTLHPHAAELTPLEAIMRPLRHDIMAEIEKHLFGDFNRRT